MNIMRRIVGGAPGRHCQDAFQTSQQTELGIMHLKKLYCEFSHPSHHLSDKEREDKMYNMLPLFNKTFSACPSTSLTEKFPDRLSFTQQISKLMVNEIKKRAAHQSTEAASKDIVKFLEIENSEESSRGWMLLTAINILAAGDSAVIEVMTSASLPSTLVKCLYLFFDLPPVNEGASPNAEFSPEERRLLLQKVFVEVLVKLCSHLAPAEELARKDDLSLLFGAITSSCPPHNTGWRKSATEVLMTLSRHGLNERVINYIHFKGCVALCLENMQRVQELSPLEIVEMFVTLFCFLKDSSEVSQTLLDDFRNCHGYAYLSDFLLRLEKDHSEEARDAVRNLVLIVASLAMCGFHELKPNSGSCSSLFKLPGFTMPNPSGQGASVRNIEAFKVLQSVFLKATSINLCGVILDAISSVYHADNANYFILENQHTLSQFSERIYLKPPEIQEKFFQLLEFIVFHLNFVPCKELISFSLLLKAQQSIECCILCMQTLLNILRHDAVFRDVYREVGLLEVMVGCLEKFSSLIKQKSENPEPGNELEKDQETFGFMIMETLDILVSSSASNAGVFKESGGARCIHSMIPFEECRTPALGIIKQLVFCTGAEDDFATLLGFMHSAPKSSLKLKIDILQAVLHCLRDSHRTRTIFRRVNGFVYVLHVLVSMEGSLRENPPSPWDAADRDEVWTAIHCVFNTLTIAMRFEPGNAKFFHHEMCYSSFCRTLRLLGCFSSDEILGIPTVSLPSNYDATFQPVFISYPSQASLLKGIPASLCYACWILRLLYEMALDSFDKPDLLAALAPKPSTKATLSVDDEKMDEPLPSPKKPPPGGLNLSAPLPDPLIVHPGVVVTMLHLLPSLQHEHEYQLALGLQVYCGELLKSLMRTERNQQVMCDAGFSYELLSKCSQALEDESHVLHPVIQYMLERLAAQTLEPNDLRMFLRLNSPLCCDDKQGVKTVKSEEVIPLTRVKTLVSMTTPKDCRMGGSSITPPFVEFDMSIEGFGCLFLPSLAPQTVSAPSVVGVGSPNAALIGGIGTGDRIFPPQTGLSFSTWICIDKYSDPRSDPHCVRLLTIVRTSQGKEQLICLNVILAARDKAVIVSTFEKSLPQPGQSQIDWEPDVVGDWGVREWCPNLLYEGQWHHIVVVLNRAVLKNSSFSLFVDGEHITSKKLHYIPQNPGGGSATLSIASAVYAYIGTPPHYRRQSRLLWKQGPSHLIEDILTPHVVQVIYNLGPNYMGSLQAPELFGIEPMQPLVSEDKVIFGLNALAMSQLTLSRIRKVYSRVDSRSIAKQLGMSTHDNATPVRVLHNSSGHLNGPARSLGGVVIGYLGVRVFCPRPVARMIENVGGCPVLLGLVAAARNVESLYAAVKALVCVVRSNKNLVIEMDRIKGYQILSFLLWKKRSLLNSHILHLAFSLVGTVDSGRETPSIPNISAFKDLLADIEMWHEAPADLEKSLYEHFLELLRESSEHRNWKVLTDCGIVQRLLRVLYQSHASLPETTQHVTYALLASLLYRPKAADLLRHFVVATLPIFSVSESHLNLSEEIQRMQEEKEDSSCSSVISAQNVLLRNKCLYILYGLILSGKGLNLLFSEEVIRVLGFDWILLFLQGHLHSSTVTLCLRILTALLSDPNLLQKFREASCNGSWLNDTEPIVENRVGVLLGFNVGLHTLRLSGPREIKEEAFSVPGFQMLNWLMPKHILIRESYYFMCAIILGLPIRILPPIEKFGLESLWMFLFGSGGNPVNNLNNMVNICPDAIITSLHMLRTLLNPPANMESIDWVQDCPTALIQFLMYLYHNVPEFMHAFLSTDILAALTSTVFPFQYSAPNSSSTPLEEIKEMPDSVFKASVEVVKEKESGLSTHIAKKYVMDFLRMAVLDSLSLPMPGKGPPVIDMILETFPNAVNHQHLSRFQTDLLGSLMDHLVAVDVLADDGAGLPLPAGGSPSHVTNSVFYLAARLVDKLWQGLFTKDAQEVFDFLIKIISQAKKRNAGISLESIFHSLNRTVLYLLSRPSNQLSGQMVILETMYKLTLHRNIVFGAGNHELEFVGCLIYCLLQLTEVMEVRTSAKTKTTWHVNPSLDDLRSQEGHQTMIEATNRVWEELYVCKKPAIEEVFRVSFPWHSKTPDLQSVRDLVFEAASKVWIAYVESERKKSYKAPFELHTQIQSKLQKVTGGLSRLASRTKSKREDTIKVRFSNASSLDVQSWVFNHISIVRDLVEFKQKQLQLSRQHMQKYVLDDWQRMEKEVTRERGLWGPMNPNPLNKWQLDMTEGPCRMRKKLIENDLFYIHYPYQSDMDQDDNRLIKYKVPTSSHSKLFYLKSKPQELCEPEGEITEKSPEGDKPLQSPSAKEESNVETDDSKNEAFQGLQGIRPGVSRTLTEWEDDQETSTPEAGDVCIEGQTPMPEEKDNPDNQSVLRLLERGEKISHMFRCARIQGLETVEGLILFGKEHYYFVEGFTLLRTREIRAIDHLPSSLHDPIVPSATNINQPLFGTRQCSKFSYEDIKEVHKRRYLLLPIALEMFSADGRNSLLAFPRGVRNKVYQKCMSVATDLSDDAQQSVAGQKRGANIEQSAGLFSTLIGETSVTQRWVRGEISNFQYLMHLNTLAGRSYNDLMQYPVFPWVLADYESDLLDLTDSKTFRDLSKPMGAQSTERLEQFRKRYREWDDPNGETPPYHYGTHYSSAMIVCSYLVRMEPFTQHFLRLQGGHFDLADRMFHSIKEGWLSASKHNMADVKELIPEFFYLPEFLLNSNRFDLGAKQSGVQLDDVVLPPWAKGDPREFIRMHRLALECDYVSQHLHLWIDLIFGFKQQGPPAVEATNVFHHLFYEGNVDIYSIDDPLKKNATIGFINNFGQIPKQLFKKPHPSKKVPGNRVSIIEPGPVTPGFGMSSGDKLFYHNVSNLRPSMSPVKELKGSVGQIIATEKMILAVEQNKVLIPPHFSRYYAWGFADQSVRIGSYDSDKASFVCETWLNGEVLSATCPNAKTFITGGTSTVVNVWDFSKKRMVLKKSLYGHTEAVTAVASSLAYQLIVSGSRDRTAIVWDLSRLTFVQQLMGHIGPVAAVAINESSGDIATCAGTCLHLWSINGDPVASINTSMGSGLEKPQQILCVGFSTLNEWDSQNVIMTGSSDGIVRMWSLEYVQVLDNTETKSESGQNASNLLSVPEHPSSYSKESQADSLSEFEVEHGEEVHESNPPANDFSRSSSEATLSGDEGNGLGDQDDNTGQGRDSEEKQAKIGSNMHVSQRLQRQEALESVGSQGSPDTFSTEDFQPEAFSSPNVSENPLVKAKNPSENISDGTDAIGQSSVRLSKSDTNISDSFVVISDSEINEIKKEQKRRDSILREGHKWECQLIFRSKLTMHTAYNRKDNTEPAAVTALAVSKDHRTVYVGDARGRVFSWCVTDQPGRAMADHWTKDEVVDVCTGCHVRFSIYERKHHCRNCGQVFCSRCSHYQSEISRLRIFRPVRVCHTCYEHLRS